jgi:hypothetical protein
MFTMIEWGTVIKNTNSPKVESCTYYYCAAALHMFAGSDKHGGRGWCKLLLLGALQPFSWFKSPDSLDSNIFYASNQMDPLLIFGVMVDGPYQCVAVEGP